MQLLLQEGADPNSTDAQGNKFFDYMLVEPHKKVVQRYAERIEKTGACLSAWPVVPTGVAALIMDYSRTGLSAFDYSEPPSTLSRAKRWCISKLTRPS
jgi:hypothetical protein